MRETLAKNIMDLMRDYLNQDPDAGFDGTYVGIVENNRDKEQIGRCLIRIHGIHDGYPTEDLQWMEPEFPLAIGLHGSFIVPEIGTSVNVHFVNGDIYQPRYTTKSVDRVTNNFKADKSENYPDTCILYETEGGDYMKINRAKGEFMLKTAAGCILKMNQNGDVEIDNTNTNDGNMSLHLLGNFTVDNRLGNTSIITNECNVSAFGAITVKSNESLEVDTLGSQTYRTNDSYDVVANDRIALKSKNCVRSESKEQEIRGNTITIDPATPGHFTLAIGSDVKQSPYMTVEMDPLGGPFNCIPFDTLTGQPHQGRIVSTDALLPSDLVDKTKEVSIKTAQITSKYASLISSEVGKIVKKYSGMDMGLQLLVNGLKSTIISDTKASEISALSASYTDKMTTEISNVETDYNSFITKGVLLDEKSAYDKYKLQLESPKTTARVESDITGKETAKTVAGAGKGLVNDE